MRSVLSCFLAAFIVACADSQGVNCTDILRIVSVMVTDTAGQPLDSLSRRTTVRATQIVLLRDSSLLGVLGPGEYEVVTDAHQDLLQPGDNVLDFRAWDASHLATGTFVIALVPCHISRREGPDAMVATSTPFR